LQLPSTQPIANPLAEAFGSWYYLPGDNVVCLVKESLRFCWLEASGFAIFAEQPTGFRQRERGTKEPKRSEVSFPGVTFALVVTLGRKTRLGLASPLALERGKHETIRVLFRRGYVPAKIFDNTLCWAIFLKPLVPE
jgi:hypothetical protein